MLSQPYTRRLLAAAIVVFMLAPLAAEAEAETPYLASELYNAVGDYGFYKKPEYLEPVKQLLAKGAVPDNRTLVIAIDSRVPEVLDMLLAKKPDINTPYGSNGETLLTFTLAKNSAPDKAEKGLQMAKSLIKAGADVNAVVHSGTNSPLKLAAVGDHVNPPNPAFVKLLLASGADAKAGADKDYSPVVNMAASNLEILTLLLDAGASPYQFTGTGATPLHYVCDRPLSLKNQPDPQAAQRIALLVEKGSSIDAIHPQSGGFETGTPLREASRSDNPDCVAALIAAGASLDAPAFTPYYLKHYPQTQQVSVREYVLARAKKPRLHYSPEVIKLFQ